MELISVIIPTYNEAETLEVAVRSIMEQTYKSLEIIVSDDKSTDNTREIVEKLQKEDPRVRYLLCPYEDPHRVDFRGTNISVGYLARNYAMEQSRGEWITFQDADDASLLNRVAVQYDLAMQYNATLITTDCIPFREDLVGKKLNVETFVHDHPDFVLLPDETTARTAEAKGLLMRNWFPHRFVPFFIKRRIPFVRRLFLKPEVSYPGADNSMFFKREVIKKVQFRQRDDRIWPAKSGRGVGRDFVFQVAETFKNSWAFTLPLYLWRVKNPDYAALAKYEKYLV